MKSESIAKLAEALSKAQAEFRPAPFNATNPFLKNRYADLGSVIETTKDAMQKYGLVITQMVTGDGGDVGITTILMHSPSGEWIGSTVTIPLDEKKGNSSAQVAGSIVTYLRRYAWAAALGIYTEEDTDAHHPPAKQEAKQPAKQPTNGKTTGNAPMTLAEAMQVTNSKGEPYGDIPTETLANMANSIAKVEKRTAEHETKLLAIQIILKHRNEMEKNK